MARIKLSYIMGCPGLKSSYQEKDLLSEKCYVLFVQNISSKEVRRGIYQYGIKYWVIVMLKI